MEPKESPVSKKYTKFDAVFNAGEALAGSGILSYCALHSLGVPQDYAEYGSLGLALLVTWFAWKISKNK
ncbi:MAG: hypothetical protein GTN37_01450 [Candidatus Aenigmarchaeota archaeon]|nr:hypothetical protein [Candidatus Aenigmarchaeota archaeon]NIS73076.1 hypothetical protein [Candidatus Aenigmarchaeota archaeon]